MEDELSTRQVLQYHYSKMKKPMRGYPIMYFWMTREQVELLRPTCKTFVRLELLDQQDLERRGLL